MNKTQTKNMQKDFKTWHKQKTRINSVASVPYFHEREIWFCYMGANVGFEQDGRGVDFQRPVIVIKKFNNRIGWVVPLSRTKRRGQYYHEFTFGKNEVSVAILSQLRLLDAHRLSRRIGTIKEVDFEELIKKLKDLFP